MKNTKKKTAKKTTIKKVSTGVYMPAKWQDALKEISTERNSKGIKSSVHRLIIEALAEEYGFDLNDCNRVHFSNGSANKKGDSNHAE